MSQSPYLIGVHMNRAQRIIDWSHWLILAAGVVALFL